MSDISGISGQQQPQGVQSQHSHHRHAGRHGHHGQQGTVGQQSSQQAQQAGDQRQGTYAGRSPGRRVRATVVFCPANGCNPGHYSRNAESANVLIRE
jgi:hypothetical protein